MEISIKVEALCPFVSFLKEIIRKFESDGNLKEISED
jgi:hypothetical protein